MQDNSEPFQLSDQAINFTSCLQPQQNHTSESSHLSQIKADPSNSNSNLLNNVGQLNPISIMQDQVSINQAFNQAAVGNVIANFASGLNPPKLSNTKKITRRKFTPEEDEILKNLVTTYGSNDWTSIASHFVGRSARQCRERWKHYISPDVTKDPWTEEENQLLIQKHEEHGSQWAIIAKSFPGRTDIGVKNHYISITTRKNKELSYQSSKSHDENQSSDVNHNTIDNSNNDATNLANSFAQDIVNAMQMGQLNIPTDQIQIALQQIIKQTEEKGPNDHSSHEDPII